MGGDLQLCTNDEDRVQKVVLFCAWLMDTPRGFRGNQVIRPLQALNDKLAKRGKLSRTWYESEPLRQIRRAARLTNLEYREQKKNASPDFLPITADMIVILRNRTWVVGDWSATGMDSKRAGVGVRLGWDSGMRVGHLAVDGEKRDHIILKEDTWFIGNDGYRVDVEKVKQSFMKADGEVDRAAVDVRIDGFDACVWTDKISRSTGKKPELKELARNSEMESELLTDLFEFMCHAGAKPTDPFLHRYAPRGKYLRRKDIQDTIKDLASDPRVQLDPVRFNTRSMRIGFSSGAVANRIDPAVIRMTGGWSKNSNVYLKHYTKGGSKQGMLAVGDTGAQTIKDIRKL